MKKWAALFLAIFAVILSIASWVKASVDTSDQEIIAGVIRSEDEQGWYVIDDPDHTSINIQSVKAEDGLILVTYSKEFGRIHTFIATPDETFAKEGYQVGASVDRDKARILVFKMVQGETVPIDASTIRSKWGNIWLYGVFERKASNIVN